MGSALIISEICTAVNEQYFFNNVSAFYNLGTLFI